MGSAARDDQPFVDTELSDIDQEFSGEIFIPIMNRYLSCIIRWYELRSPATTPVLYQQGTFNPNATFRWMGSAAMDKLGNIAIGYSTSSSNVAPGIGYATRAPGDTLGALSNETAVVTGSGVQTGTLHRRGDYSSMVVDPVNDCTFWYTNEYQKTDGSFNWNTYINSFKVTTCQ